jgi:hypothetical protein
MVLTCEQVRQERANSLNGSWRSLYDCFHARVKGKLIYCEKGHRLCENANGKGAIGIERLAKGNPLILGICQKCSDFTSMGDPLFPEERGWLRTGIDNKQIERLICQKSLVR